MDRGPARLNHVNHPDAKSRFVVYDKTGFFVFYYVHGVPPSWRIRSFAFDPYWIIAIFNVQAESGNGLVIFGDGFIVLLQHTVDVAAPIIGGCVLMIKANNHIEVIDGLVVLLQVKYISPRLKYASWNWESREMACV